MALQTTSGLTPYWWTPETEMEEDDPLRFKLKPLTGEALDHVMEGATYAEQGGTPSLTAKGVKYAVTHGVLDWENWNDERGPVKYAPQNYPFIPFQYRYGIAVELILKSIMQEEESKNS